MTSTIVTIEEQIDGRRYVTEKHIDSTNTEHIVEYLADVDTDTNKMLETHASTISDLLKELELNSWLNKVKNGEAVPLSGCLYVTREEVFKYCFDNMAFSKDVADFYKAAWMVPYFTDEEFVAMGFTTEQITGIRSNAAILAEANNLLNTVTPLEAT